MVLNQAVQKPGGDKAGRVDREERRATDLSQVSPSPCWVTGTKKKRREEGKQRTNTVSHREEGGRSRRRSYWFASSLRMSTEAPCHKPAFLRLELSWNVHICLVLISRLECEEHFHGIHSIFDPDFTSRHNWFAGFVTPLAFKDLFFSTLERAPAASYPGCEGKNCSAAPSLPPAQMRLGRGWTAHRHLK